jgi:lysophospholipase L1-like esterase
MSSARYCGGTRGFTSGRVYDSSDITFRAHQALYVRPDAQARIIEDISRLQDLARNHNAWIEFFVFPYEYQLRWGQEEGLLPQQVIKAAASDAGITIHDLYRPLADYLRASGETSKSLYLFSDPMHFSPAGNDVVARLVQTRIAQRLDHPQAHRAASAVSGSMEPPLDQRRN